MRVNGYTELRNARLECCGHEFWYDLDWRKPNGRFTCPNCGSKRIWVDGDSDEKREADRLRRELATVRAERNRAREAEQEATARAAQINRSHQRMRANLVAGRCPCCSVEFPDLAEHLRAEHPDFGPGDRVRHTRTVYGMTQKQVGEELGMPASYVSMAENGGDIPTWARVKLMHWAGADLEGAA